MATSERVFLSWLQPGDFEAVARAGDLFRQAGYNQAGVLNRYGIKRLAELISAVRRPDLPAVESPLDILAQIFLEGTRVERATAERILGSGAIPLFERLGMFTESGPVLLASVTVAPIGELIVASDRWNMPDRTPVFDIIKDAVYPAHSPEARDLLDAIPECSEGDVLDLGTGTGILALIYASRGCRVVATDIAERCSIAARFNFGLNRLRAEAILTGDGLAPVRGREFDLIISHPPYVPKLDRGYVCSDGGDDGEYLLRSIIENLPDFLRRGGRCHVEALSSDRRGAAVEARFRGMLGENAPEFDIGIFARRFITARQWIDSKGTEWEEPLGAWGVERFVIGSFLFRRRIAGGQPFTIRYKASNRTGTREIAWAFAVQEWLGANPIDDCVLRISPKLSLMMTLERDNGEWAETSQRFAAEQPLEISGESSAWLAWIFHSGEGLTVRQCWERLRERDLIPQDLDLATFTGPVRQLMASGVFEPEAVPFSRPPL